MIINNEWNRADAGAAPYSQHVTVDANYYAARWDWQWPQGGGSVKAYPEILFGQSPWFTPASGTSKLPAAIANIQTLSAAFDVSGWVQVGTVGDLAFDLWVTSDIVPTSSNIVAEVMVWEKTYGSFLPSAFIAHVTIDGEAYDLYGHAGTWQYYALVKITQTMTGVCPIGKVMKFMVDNGYIANNLYLPVVEFGNEIVVGVGQMTLNKFMVTL